MWIRFGWQNPLHDQPYPVLGTSCILDLQIGSNVLVNFLQYACVNRAVSLLNSLDNDLKISTLTISQVFPQGVLLQCKGKENWVGVCGPLPKTVTLFMT